MAKLGTWSTTAGNNNSTPPDGWPEGQAPSTVNDCAREMMASLRTVFNDSQFVDQNFVPTFNGAASFTVPGDQTSAIHAGRRLKFFDGNGGSAMVGYATVQTASFTVVTTVNVIQDGGNFTNSLSSFALSILARTNDAIPRGISTSSGHAASGLSATGSITTTQAFVHGMTISPYDFVKGSAILFDVFHAENGSLTGAGVVMKLYIGTDPDPISNPGSILAQVTCDSHSDAEMIHYTAILNCMSVGPTGNANITGAICAHRAPGINSLINPPHANNASTNVAALVVDTKVTNYVRLMFFQYTGVGATAPTHTFYAGIVKKLS